MTEDELAKVRGLPPPKPKPQPERAIPTRTLDSILQEVDLGKADPFGEHGTSIIVLRLAGLNVFQIADKLHLEDKSGLEHIRQVLYLARKEARLADVTGLLDHRAVPGAVDNLIKGIDEGDKEYSLAVLKGRGAFRNFERTDADTKMSLEISIEGLERDDRKTAVEGTIVGMPRESAQPPRLDED